MTNEIRLDRCSFFTVEPSVIMSLSNNNIFFKKVNETLFELCNNSALGGCVTTDSRLDLINNGGQKVWFNSIIFAIYPRLAKLLRFPKIQVPSECCHPPSTLLQSVPNFRHAVPTKHPLQPPHPPPPHVAGAGMLMRSPVAIATGGSCFGD